MRGKAVRAVCKGRKDDKFMRYYALIDGSQK
jgi:hypothetical protein